MLSHLDRVLHGGEASCDSRTDLGDILLLSRVVPDELGERVELVQRTTEKKEEARWKILRAGDDERTSCRFRREQIAFDALEARDGPLRVNDRLGGFDCRCETKNASAVTANMPSMDRL